MSLLNLPNVLTIARVLIVPFFVMALLYHYHYYALVLFVTASITDLLDGMAARMRNEQTQFGKVLDPIADKLLMVASFVIFTMLEWIPLWLTITVLSRDIIVIAGTIILYLSTDKLAIEVTKTGKTAMALQAALLAYILFMVNFSGGPGNPLILFLAVLVTTIVSGVQYIFRGLRVADGA